MVNRMTIDLRKSSLASRYQTTTTLRPSQRAGDPDLPTLARDIGLFRVPVEETLTLGLSTDYDLGRVEMGADSS